MRPKTSPVPVLSASGLKVRSSWPEHVVVEFLVLGSWAARRAGSRSPPRCDSIAAMMACGAVVTVGQGDQVVELRLGPQEDRALLGEVLLGQRPRLAAARGQRAPRSRPAPPGSGCRRGAGRSGPSPAGSIRCWRSWSWRADVSAALHSRFSMASMFSSWAMVQPLRLKTARPISVVVNTSRVTPNT